MTDQPTDRAEELRARLRTLSPAELGVALRRVAILVGEGSLASCEAVYDSLQADCDLVQAEWDRRCAEREAEQAELERQCEAAESRVAELAGEMSSAWAELPVIREQEPRANLSLPQQCRVVAEVYTHQERRAEAAEAEVKRLRERWTKYGVTVLDQPLTDALTQRLRDATDRAEAAEAELERLRKVVQQAASDLTRAGFDWLENRHGMKSQGGQGLFHRTTHIDSRLRNALEPQPQEPLQ